jgi:hypothetical protein
MESTMNRGFHGVLGIALAVAALAPADRQALAQEPAPRAEPAFEAGGLAYDIGYYTIRRPDAAAGSGSRGKFIVIWKQAADGTWKIHADGFSEVRESAAAAGEGK